MKQSLYLLTVLLSIVLVEGPARADFERSSEKPKSAKFEAGRKAVEAKDFKAAVGLLTQAARETPKDADVENLLGYSYRKLGQYDKALEHYQAALKLDPGHRGAHEYMGELYLETDRLADAENELKALSKACPWFGKCEEYEDLKGEIEKYKAKKK